MLDRVFVGILVVIFGGIVLHAPLTVGFSTLFPDYSLVIKSWKEILLGVALLLSVVLLTTKKQWKIIKSKIVYIIAAYAALHVLMIPPFYTGFDATVAGLFINLRYLLFFVLVYVALKLYPQLTRLFIWTFLVGAGVVIGFAILQLTVLPNDILRHVGYGPSTIMPYLTVDQNENYIRINSTLRGPNPLGAYAAIVMACVAAYVATLSEKVTKSRQIGLWVLGLGSAATLWASYSRSSALAALAAIAVVVLVVYGRRITKAVWIAFGIVALTLVGSIVAFQDTEFVSQVILHEDPNEGNDVNSNDGHAESLLQGVRLMATQPFGRGVGSTGSASLLTDHPIIIENQYLFIAHEVGWVGLGLFLALTYIVLYEAWRRRSDWLALAVFASGVGLLIAAVFLPVWVDDTVSIIWWGLAAIVIGKPVRKVKRS